MKPEIQTTEHTPPATMIAQAIQSGADLSQVRELIALQKEWEANEARKAYHKAMAQFKANPPKIEKDRKVGYSTSKGNVGYSHATLANVTEKINKELSKYGLSASWQTEQNGKVVVTCKITHELGHSEETSLSADADTSGSKNPIQAIGSTITYLERYTLLAMTGLATSEQDNDAGGQVEKISEKQLHILRDALASISANEGKFCGYMGVDNLEALPASQFNKAITAIESKKKKREAKNENN